MIDSSRCAATTIIVLVVAVLSGPAAGAGPAPPPDVGPVVVEATRGCNDTGGTEGVSVNVTNPHSEPVEIQFHLVEPLDAATARPESDLFATAQPGMSELDPIYANAADVTVRLNGEEVESEYILSTPACIDPNGPTAPPAPAPYPTPPPPEVGPIVAAPVFTG